MILPFTLTDIVTPLQTAIASFRTSMCLPQLTGPDGQGTGTICVGPEYLAFQLSPPGVILVPRDEDIDPTCLNDGTSDGTSPYIPRAYWRGALGIEAWCWGDEDPDFDTTQNTTFSYDSALEIRREVCLALAQFGGVAEIGRIRGRWEQPSNDKRLGRLYVLSFQVWTPINDLSVGAYEVEPFSTSTIPGFSITSTVVSVPFDGSSAIPELAIIAPPP